MNAALWLILFRGGEVAAAARSSVIVRPLKIDIETHDHLTIKTRAKLEIATHDIIEER
jgi:hypothetical protein